MGTPLRVARDRIGGPHVGISVEEQNDLLSRSLQLARQAQDAFRVAWTLRYRRPIAALHRGDWSTVESKATAFALKHDPAV